MLLLFALACAPKALPPPPAEAVRGELLVDQSLKDRLSDDPADLVVFYGGEEKGSLQTCGCPHRPRGSISRVGSYVSASREHQPETPSVLVNGGYWLEDATDFDGQVRADVAMMNQWMVKGLTAAGWDALNATPNDLSGIKRLREAGVLGDPGSAGGLPVVSANIVGPGIAPYVVIEKGALKVGITGIAAAAATLGDSEGYEVKSLDVARVVVDELARKADVIVLLAWHAPEAAKALAQANPAIDLVIDTNRHTDFTPPFVIGHAVWVQSHSQTMRLGEARMTLRDGAVVGTVDRKIDMDPSLPEDKALKRIQDDALADVSAVQATLFGP